MDFKDFKQELLGRVRGFHKLTIIGIGADLRQDDAIGNILARNLIKETRIQLAKRGISPLTYEVDESVQINKVFILNASVVPEQYITTLISFNADVIIIIDAAMMGNEAKPGSLGFISIEKLDTIAFSSHTLPLGQFINLMIALGCQAKINVIGIQPRDLDYGEELSPPVQETLEYLNSLLIEDIIPIFL